MNNLMTKAPAAQGSLLEKSPLIFQANQARMALRLAVAIMAAESPMPAQLELAKSHLAAILHEGFNEDVVRCFLAIIYDGLPTARNVNEATWQDLATALLRSSEGIPATCALGPSIIAFGLMAIVEKEEFVPSPSGVLQVCENAFDEFLSIGWRLQKVIDKTSVKAITHQAEAPAALTLLPMEIEALVEKGERIMQAEAKAKAKLKFMAF